MATILLIDDDDEIRAVIHEMLARAGHGVEEAEDGIAGFEKFAAGRFDIVIADIFMPGEDGIATIRKIRDQDPFVGILAISGGHACKKYDVLHMSMELGADVGLPKPFSREQLLAKIDDAADRRRERCE